MSMSAIAQVCTTKRQNVMNLLKEFFVRLIEISKHEENIKIDLKIGFIYIRDNGETEFL